MRKRKEEARRIEEVARQIKKDRMRLAQLRGSQRSSTTPAVSDSLNLSESTQYKTSKNKIENRTRKFNKRETDRVRKFDQLIETSKTKEESRKAFFGKTIDKIKSGFKKGVDKVKPVFIRSVDFVKGILPFMDSEEELMVKAEGLCRVKGRLLSLGQLVYQSVKAPQIERQDKERRRPFDDYEIIRDKPAGVIVKIRKKRRIIREGLKFPDLNFDADELIQKFDFYLSLKIEGQPYDETLCSKILNKEDVEFKQDLLKDYPRETSFITEKSYCSFSWSDLEDEYIYKFISLPTGLREPLGQDLGPVEVEILSQLRPKNSLNNEFVELCESSKTFTVDRLEPRSFKVLFTGITPLPISECKVKDEDNKGGIKQAFTATKEQDIWDYLNSKEVSKDFYNMFPVSKRRPNKPQIELLTNHKNQLAYPYGSCDKSLTGLFQDAFSLHHLGLKYGADRIVAVFNEDYETYHTKYIDKYGEFDGLAFLEVPTWYIPTPWGDIHIPPGIKTGVTIVKAGREDYGVFLHEMAHLFGQLKEFYEPQNKNQEQFYCSQFTRRGKLPGKEEFFFSKDKITGIPCYNYRVTGGLVRERDIRPRLSQEPRRQVWKLLNNQKSIMHGSSKIRKNDIYHKWIDRETYQKVLAVMDNNLKIPKDFFKRIKGYKLNDEPRIIEAKNRYNNIINCAFQKRPVISVTGIYSKRAKKKDRFKSFSAKVFNIKNPKLPFSFSEVSIEPQDKKEDYIKIELRRKGRLDQAMLFPRSSHIEVFYGGRIELKEVESVPIFTAFFPVCESFNKDDYRVSVKEVYIEGGVKKEELLIDSAPLKLEKDKGLET